MSRNSHLKLTLEIFLRKIGWFKTLEVVANPVCHAILSRRSFNEAGILQAAAEATSMGQRVTQVRSDTLLDYVLGKNEFWSFDSSA